MGVFYCVQRQAYLNMILGCMAYWNERNAFAKYNRILITDNIFYGKFYTCRPQNVHIAGIALTPTAVAAVCMCAISGYYTLTPIYSHTLHVSEQCGYSLQIIFSHFILECSYLSTTISKYGISNR